MLHRPHPKLEIRRLGLPLFRRLYRHPRAPVVHRLQWARLHQWLERRRRDRWLEGIWGKPLADHQREELEVELLRRRLEQILLARYLARWPARPLPQWFQDRLHPRPSP